MSDADRVRPVVRRVGTLSRIASRHGDPQCLSKSQSPATLCGRVWYLVLPKLNLEVLPSTPEGMEWNAVVHRRIQIVRFIVPHDTITAHAVSLPPQSGEYRVSQAAVQIARERDFPGP